MKVAHIAKSLDYGVGIIVYYLCKYANNYQPIVIVKKTCAMSADIKTPNVPFYVAKDNATFKQLLKTVDIINFHCFDNDFRLYEILKTFRRQIVLTLHMPIILPKINSLVICTAGWIKTIQNDSNQCIVIENRIDLERFHPIKKVYPHNKIIIARICRENKCDEFFWPATIEVLNERKNVNLWIIGEKGGSTQRIKRLGFRTDIPKILSKVDIVVHTPSPKTGTKDLSLMEAMAIGIPTILSAVETNKASVKKEQGCFFVNPGDSMALKEKLLFLIDNPKIRSEIGSIAAKIAVEKFDAKYMVKQYEDTYRILLTKHNT